MSSLKKLYSQSFIYGLSTVLPRLLNYLLVFLHTRVFLPAEYGIITELYAYVTFFLILLTFGLETGFFRFASKRSDIEEVYPTTFYFLFLSSLFFSLIFIFSSGFISSQLGEQYDRSYIVYLGLIVCIDSFSAIPFAKLRFQNKAFIFSFIKVLGVLVNVVLNLLLLKVIPQEFLHNLFGKISLISFVFVANLIQSSLVLVLVLYYTKIPKIAINKVLLKDILLYSLPLLLAGLGGTTNESFDRIFLRFLLPVDSDPQYQLGIYGSNSKLAVLLLLFIQMYRFAAEPYFFQNQKEDKTGKFFEKALNAFVIFCLLIFLLISLNIPIIKFFVGEGFREKMMIVPLMLIANILYGTFFNLSFWYKLEGKTMYGVKYTFIGASITIVANLILIPWVGIFGAALSRILCYSVMNILVYRDGKRSGYVSINKSKLIIYSLITVGIFGITILTFLFNQIFSVILGNLLILGFVFFIFKKEEISLQSIFKA